MSENPDLISHNKTYWGPEFAEIVDIPWTPELDEIAGMGAYTMLYKIADEFADGKFRKEILEMYGKYE